MIRFLLDTNAVISLLKTRASLLAERVRSHPPESVAISSIVMFELYYGAFKSARRIDDLALLDKTRFQILPFEIDDARHAGEIRAVLKASGSPIGPYDVLIAGQARARDLTLVTSSLSEFKRAKGLRLEDWSVQ